MGGGRRPMKGAYGSWRTSCGRLSAPLDDHVALIDPGRRKSTAEVRSLPPKATGLPLRQEEERGEWWQLSWGNVAQPSTLSLCPASRATSLVGVGVLRGAVGCHLHPPTPLGWTSSARRALLEQKGGLGGGWRPMKGTWGHWRTSGGRPSARPDRNVALGDPSRRNSTAEARSLSPKAAGSPPEARGGQG